MSSTQSEPASARPTRPWPADRVERWPIERLIPYANNPRLHSEADIDKIADAILKWGWTMPPLVDEEGVLIAGHGRVGAAAKLQLKSIPVIVARGWSEEEKRAYRLADNQLAARASWDPEQLRNELQELGFAGFDLDLIGFEPDQLETILAGLGSSGLAKFTPSMSVRRASPTSPAATAQLSPTRNVSAFPSRVSVISPPITMTRASQSWAWSGFTIPGWSPP